MSNSITQTRICVQKVQMKERNLKSIDPLNYTKKLAAAFNVKKLWKPNTVITIAFLSDGEKIPRTPTNSLQFVVDENSEPLKMDPLQKELDNIPIIPAIKRIVKERIEPLTNLKFIFIDDEKDFELHSSQPPTIRISFDPDGGAWSLLGTDCIGIPKEEPTMNLGWFDVATTIHEFGHALGMIHEHQNPKQLQDDNKIHWDSEKVYAWASSTQGWDKEITDANILNMTVDGINGSNFDPLSIMLYFFPGSLTTDNRGTHQNLRLSGLDVEWISKMYPKNGEDIAQFYMEIYDEDIQANIQKSFALSYNYAHSKWSFLGNKVVSVIIIVGLLIILWFIFKKFRKGKY